MPQNEIQIYLRKLKDMQAEYSHASLTKPGGNQGFDYGLACGKYQGLLLAEQLLTQTIEEVANDEN